MSPAEFVAEEKKHGGGRYNLSRPGRRRALSVRQVRKLRRMYYVDVVDEEGRRYTQERLGRMYRLPQSAVNSALRWNTYVDVDPGLVLQYQEQRIQKLAWLKRRRDERRIELELAIFGEVRPMSNFLRVGGADRYVERLEKQLEKKGQG